MPRSTSSADLSTFGSEFNGHRTMTKYEWTMKQVAEATKEYPPSNRQYIDAFLAEVERAGESLTRVRFFELFKACAPPLDADVGYFDYEVINDRWTFTADFSEAWKIPAIEPLPRITMTAKFGKRSLPGDFCCLGGTPDWIQNEKYPICPKCDANMVLFLQLKSLPYSLTEHHEELDAYTFGDAGNFYLFQCPNCGAYQNSEQCH